MTKLTPDSKSLIGIPYTNHNLECPFCKTMLEVIVTARVADGDVRHVGTENMAPVFSVNLNAEIETVKIGHSCRGPKKTS